MEETLNYIGRVVLCALLIAGVMLSAIQTDRVNKLTREAISRGYATYDSNGQFTWREQR